MTDIPFRDRAVHNEVAAHRDRVLNFRQWCQVNGFSEATGHRLIKAGEGPPVLQLSARRIGIRESDNAAWQASRTRGAAA
jgi:predicted DNA-binding transcriptional regulator AlpA